MKILITGGSGLLGKSLIETAPPEHEISATWFTNYTDIDLPAYRLNITDKAQVGYVFTKAQPEVVIHCAASGSVDYAEDNYQIAHLTNVNGTENIMSAAKDCGAKVIHISSNAVFGGQNPPYFEDDPRRPVNAYGSINKQAEDAVRAGLHWVIVRPFLLYGWPYPGGRQNWATIIADKLSQGKSMKLVNDVIWMPTYARDCAATIWELIGQDNEIYHVAGKERITLYDFGLKVAEVFGLDAGLLEPVGSDYFKGMVRRPKDASYSLTKINDLGLVLNGIEMGLKLMRAAGEATYKEMAGGQK